MDLGKSSQCRKWSTEDYWELLSTPENLVSGMGLEAQVWVWEMGHDTFHGIVTGNPDSDERREASVDTTCLGSHWFMHPCTVQNLHAFHQYIIHAISCQVISLVNLIIISGSVLIVWLSCLHILNIQGGFSQLVCEMFLLTSIPQSEIQVKECLTNCPWKWYTGVRDWHTCAATDRPTTTQEPG
jgi:hypothetical protein